FDEGANKKYGDSFVDLNTEQQHEYVKEIHASALGQKFARNSQKKPFILTVKELTLLGFFTSEVGATQVLQYDPVPEAYKGCLSLEEVGKTWAT
ncbi:MAG TPA: gluconate 2-dehydrogenase subunit 3 family protein, partial [Cyclobacteriaceae bacterium]|nr:gluconate 2-dehydrogenase subunit 3 family protein [Cyclobacteriaceae bacterium]